MPPPSPPARPRHDRFTQGRMALAVAEGLRVERRGYGRRVCIPSTISGDRRSQHNRRSRLGARQGTKAGLRAVLRSLSSRSASLPMGARHQGSANPRRSSGPDHRHSRPKRARWIICRARRARIPRAPRQRPFRRSADRALAWAVSDAERGPRRPSASAIAARREPPLPRQVTARPSRGLASRRRVSATGGCGLPWWERSRG